MTEKTTLETVDEDLRSDGEYYIKEGLGNGEFLFSRKDEAIMFTFEDVSAYVEYGSEWADFEGNDLDLTLCNEQNEMWPHWIFEEFQHIEIEGELRPMEDYETRYQLKDNRGIKGAE